MPTLILDGRQRARSRVADQSGRVSAIAGQRGTPPRLGLVAFGSPGADDPYASLKIRACEEVGIDVVPALLPTTTGTAAAIQRTRELVESEGVDALFLQFPFPDGVDGAAMVEAIPEELDVDAMTESRIRRYHESDAERPPLTVAACLALIQDFELELRGLRGVLVCTPSPFAEVFQTALHRLGAQVAVVPPGAAPSDPRLPEAGLVVAAANSPGLLRSEELAPGAVVFDAGYFNPGGIGDVDVRGGIDHLSAMSPVPGGVGPMVVSMLIEGVIAFAEAKIRDG